MILADTSVCIDHLRASDPLFASLLDRGQVLVHPFVLGEISLGMVANRRHTLWLLGKMPKPIVANALEITDMIETEHLYGSGIGYVDVHLLASARLTAGASLWTRDRRLGALADRLNVSARLTH